MLPRSVSAFILLAVIVLSLNVMLGYGQDSEINTITITVSDEYVELSGKLLISDAVGCNVTGYVLIDNGSVNVYAQGMVSSNFSGRVETKGDAYVYIAGKSAGVIFHLEGYSEPDSEPPLIIGYYDANVLDENKAREALESLGLRIIRLERTTLEGFDRLYIEMTPQPGAGVLGDLFSKYYFLAIDMGFYPTIEFYIKNGTFKFKMRSGIISYLPSYLASKPEVLNALPDKLARVIMMLRRSIAIYTQGSNTTFTCQDGIFEFSGLRLIGHPGALAQALRSVGIKVKIEYSTNATITTSPYNTAIPHSPDTGTGTSLTSSQPAEATTTESVSKKIASIAIAGVAIAVTVASVMLIILRGRAG